MFTVCLDKVVGLYVNGKYNIGGTISFSKFYTLTEAKQRVADEFKNGYFNHAQIMDKEETLGEGIYRFKGEPWDTITNEKRRIAEHLSLCKGEIK